jgi:hypothetical protein
MTDILTQTEQYLPLLLNGRTADLLNLFAAGPVIDDPISGRAAGREAVEQFVAEKTAWLRERQARLEHFRTTQTAQRSVVEYVLHLVLDGRAVPLPVAVVAQQAVVGQHPDEQGLQMIRVYHSMWPLIGAHQVRPALLPTDKSLKVTDVVETYQHALAVGDVDEIMSVFEPDGYFREPAGGEHIYQGTEKLRDFMSSILGLGGITIEHCTVTDDGVACAIEFSAVRFGSHPLIPQAGVAVYERGRTGLLHAARIYDDVNVEAFQSQV